MKTLSLALTLFCATVGAGEPIITTIIARPGLTNAVDIPNGQAVRLATCYPPANTGGGYSQGITVIKNGVSWTPFRGDVFQGPVRFEVRGLGEGYTGLMTLERWATRRSTPAQLQQ